MNDDQVAIAKYVAEAAIPIPFTASTFGPWLEKRSGHPTRLLSASMGAGAPSGLFLRQAGTDYLYYEQQTSLFHQSHIILCLAARILFSESPGSSIDPRVAPDIRLQPMFRELADITVTPHQEETFAFEVLTQNPLSIPEPPAQLKPLHGALINAIPQVANLAVPAPGIRLLYRQVIEIRDAMLALRPYTDPRIAPSAYEALQAAGITGDDLNAAVEASALAAAVKAKTGDLPSWPRGGNDSTPSTAGNLASEVAWLGKISNFFTQIST